MTSSFAPLPPDADPDRWVIVRCFSRQGRVVCLVREPYVHWRGMTHLGRLHYLSKRPLRLVPVSYEWAFEGEAPDGIGLPQDETYQPQNFTQPISKRIHSPKKVLREYSRGRKEKNILAVGFDPRGKRLCEVNMTYDEWAAMDYDARKWALSNKATHPVAYFQWRYVE